MWVFGIFALSPSSIWRSSHNHHHNHNSKLRGSHIGSFPIMTKDQFLKSSKGERYQYLFMRHPLTILFGNFSVFLAGMCIFPLLYLPLGLDETLIAFLVNIVTGALLKLVFGCLSRLRTLILPV